MRSLEEMVGKMSSLSTSFWRNKRVLITGNTGFKGSWLSLWLHTLGAEVTGYSLPPESSPALYDELSDAILIETHFSDIRNHGDLSSVIQIFKPEIIFHMAAQALVKKGYSNPLETFEVNVMGTANLMDAAQKSPHLKAVVSVTSDKCYENQEWIWGYKESDRLGGYDPYSNSKACAELITQSFRDCFYNDASVGVATARAGNVIGGGDWANDRLVPDFFKAIANKEILKIRNPNAIRPWQYVLEPLRGYMALAEALYNNPKKFSGPWNFGPRPEDAKPVSWLINQLLCNEPAAEWSLDGKNTLMKRVHFIWIQQRRCGV